MKLNSLILKWYDQNKRDLPWRKTKNPYNIWISEIILQQTRMEQGIYYYNRFISKFPDLESLATSDEKDVLLLWQGLGYYSRARNLHHTAKHIYYHLDSKFPDSYDELINLKGMTQGMLVILGQKNIKKLSDFADLSTDELVGGYDEVKGKKVRMQGYLEEFSLTREEADQLIMSARNIVFK